MKCFAFGLLSLLSVVGVPFVIMAMATQKDEPRVFFGFCFSISVLSVVGFPFALATAVMSATVRKKEKRLWNAAQPYRVWGDVCSMLGIVASFVVIMLLAFLIVTGGVSGN